MPRRLRVPRESWGHSFICAVPGEKVALLERVAEAAVEVEMAPLFVGAGKEMGDAVRRLVTALNAIPADWWEEVPCPKE